MSATSRGLRTHSLRRLLGVSCLLSCFAAGTLAKAEAYRPSSDDEILERVPTLATQGPRLREIQELRDALASVRGEMAGDDTWAGDDAWEARRDDLEIATTLARRLIEFGRSEGDPRYFGYAQAALAPWWELEEPPAQVLLLRATLRQNRHDFSGALADLDALLIAQPRHPQAWLTRAVVLQVQGRPQEALASCRALRRLATPLIAAACEASAASLQGLGAESHSLLSSTLERQESADPTTRIWALTGLAEIAERLGRFDEAEMHFEAALRESRREEGLRDVYLLGAYGDFLLDRERYPEVIELLRGEESIDALLLRLTLAEAALGDPAGEQHGKTLENLFAAARRRGDETHLGNEARLRLHYFDQPEEALELALENWRDQKEPIDARWVLEAALASNQPEAARPVLIWLQQTGLEDTRLKGLQKQLQEEAS